MLTADELGGDRRIAVVSDKLVNNLFGGKNENAIGETLEVTVGDSFYEYTIVGVYQYEQNVYMMNFGSEKDINTNVYPHRHSSGRHPFHRRLHHGYRDIRPRGGFHHIRKPGGALSQRLLPH